MYKPSKEQIASWKKQYSDIFKIIVDDKCVYLKGITRDVLGRATEFGQDKIKMCEFILESLWLDGDLEIKEVDAYFLGAMSQIDQVMAIKEARLEKI